jgi:hypothetical protein
MMITRHGDHHPGCRWTASGSSAGNTQGVKVMNLEAGDAVVDVARVVKEDEGGAEEVPAVTRLRRPRREE